MNNMMEKALQKAMRLCSRSEKCTQDILDKLQLWQVPKEEHAAIIDRLYEDKFIDDARYAASYVNDKIYLSKWGRQKVRFSLAQRRISEGIITKALQQIDDERYQQGLVGLLSAKQKTIKANDDYERKVKLMRFGQSRGFSISEINNALNNIE